MAYNQKAFNELLVSIVNGTCLLTRLELNNLGLTNEDFAAFVAAVRKNEEFKNKLQVLNFDTNHISDLGDFKFSELPALETIKFSYNALITMPNFENCHKLLSIDLSCNKITGHVAAISLASVQIIDLHSNNITNTPNIEGCKKLQYLNLESNEIETFTPDEGYARVRELRLRSGNRLSEETIKSIIEFRKPKSSGQDFLTQFKLATTTLVAPVITPITTTSPNPALY